MKANKVLIWSLVVFTVNTHTDTNGDDPFETDNTQVFLLPISLPEILCFAKLFFCAPVNLH